jgi:hypothetical protein
MFICLDGIDGTGKTSIAHRLSKMLAMPVVRNSRNMLMEKYPNSVRRWVDFITMTTLHQTGVKSAIFDRSIISALVYNSDMIASARDLIPYYPLDTMWIILVGDVDSTVSREEEAPGQISQRKLEQMKFQAAYSILFPTYQMVYVVNTDNGVGVACEEIVKLLMIGDRNEQR